MEHRSDFLIIGSGIAGLSAALELAALGSVHIVTKKEAITSNTNYAQGGIAAVMDAADSVDAHVADTLRAGAGLCDERIVRLVVEEGPKRIKELMRLGVRFTGGTKHPDLGLEGGHSKRRILHSGDLTGREIERAMMSACRANGNIRFFEDHAAVDLITEGHPADMPTAKNRCLGAYVLESPTGEVRTFAARAVLLATGGAGRIYLYTSNPDIATGDGMAMAYRAGADLANLEFVQFHPTCLFNPASTEEEGRRFLISEATRGEGGVLRLKDGTRFMSRYDARAELAPRDIVARAIDEEMKRSGEDCVFLDLTRLAAAFLKKRFPKIYEHCARFGIDIAREPIPVVPAAHYFCGGVQTDAEGATTLPGLHAVGEVAHTGLHGANRLASNSLLEGAVFAHRAYRKLAALWPKLRRRRPTSAPRWNPGAAVPTSEAVVVRQDWEAVRTLMWNYVGIVRSGRRLKSARERLTVISREVSDYYWKYLLTRDLIELRNIALLGRLIVDCALSRKESRGLHYTLSHPKSLDSQKHPTIVSRYRGGRKSLGKQEAARIR